MSVQPGPFPEGGSLTGREGELVSVHVCVEPRRIEQLLETLAELPFPVNPQIYHSAGIGYVDADGRERIEPATIVEFPAFTERLEEVRARLAARGIGRDAVYIRGMLDEIHADYCVEAAPRGSAYSSIKFYKHADA